MKTSFLEYYKMILQKVSFDKKLLAKEYLKAKRTLTKCENKRLDEWLIQKRVVKNICKKTMKLT